jgi:choline-sulfatase
MSAGRPNILLIISDQQRFDWLGCDGTPGVETPAIDALAARGVRFTNCITTAPLCTPARIGLATGLLPHRIGALEETYLPAGATTYYQRLRDADYRVGAVGKIDLAKRDPYNGPKGNRPSTYRWGFTDPVEIEGKMHAGGSPTPRGPYGLWLDERGLYAGFHADYRRRLEVIYREHGGPEAWADSILPADAFADVYVGDRAVQWLEEVPDYLPWHLFVSFVGPHDPFDPPTSFADRFRDAPMPAAVEDDELRGKPAWTADYRWQVDGDDIVIARRQYTAAVAVIDEQVDRILRALDQLGHADDTIVFFASDHGEMLGDHGLFQKHVPYEGALRVPLMAAGPGIPSGLVNESIVELPDLNPTICELAGLDPQPLLDARSFVPVLRDPALSHREAGVSELTTFRLVRTRAEKLVLGSDGFRELYDLESDPGELENLAGSAPDLERRLEQQLADRLYGGKWERP